MKMRCKDCIHLNYDYIFGRYEHRTKEEGEYVCGLHGSVRVNPNGEQVNLDHRGGCDFYPKEQPPVQLELF